MAENVEKPVKKEERGRKTVQPMRPLGFSDLMPWHWGEARAGREDPFDALQGTMNRLLESFRRDVGWTERNGDIGVVNSRMDVSETEDAFEVHVELPGMDEKNVEVSVTDDLLTIRGEKKTEEAGRKKSYHYRECTYGKVERMVPVPDGVDTDRVTARFAKGVLTVTLPKTAEAKKTPRKVEISA